MKNLTPQQFVGTLRYGDPANPTVNEVAKRARFLEKYPAQEASILSYQTNPGCTCARDLIVAITSDTRDKNEVLSYIEGEPVALITPVQAIGTVVTIADTPEDWKALTTRMQTEMFMFRGLTIVPNNGTLRVFFY